MRFILFIIWGYVFLVTSFNFGQDILNLMSTKDSSFTVYEFFTSSITFAALAYPLLIMGKTEKALYDLGKYKKKNMEIEERLGSINSKLEKSLRDNIEIRAEMQEKIDTAKNQTLEAYQVFHKLDGFEEIERDALKEREKSGKS